MSRELTGGVVLTVAGGRQAVRALLEEFFTARGWRVHEHGPGRLEVETGSRRRTTFLGAFAGRHFHLSSPIELHEVPGAVEVRYLLGAGAGRALGGASGRARAARTHVETAAALEQHLGADGRAVQARRF